MRTCECLYDLIGLSDACEGQEACRLYVDTLPGIERNDFEFLTTQQTSIFSEVWEKVERRAVNRIAQDLANAMSDRFEVRPIVEDIQTGIWELPHTPEALEPKLKGYAIDLRHSRNIQAWISHVELYAQASLSDAIYIYDLYTGALLDTIPFTTLAAGFFTVTINRAYSAKSLGVFYDGSVVQSMLTQAYSDAYYENICEPCACTCTHGYCAKIDVGDPVTRDNIAWSCSGMIVHYAIHCSLEDWICRNKGRISNILWYLVGVEFFMEVIASKRLNELTLISSDRLDQLAGYANAQYQSALNAFTKGAKIEDNVCVECKSKYKRKIIIN